MFGQNNDDQNQQQSTGPTDQNPVLANSEPPASFFSTAASQNGPQAGQDVTPPAAQTDTPGSPMIMDDNPTSFVSPSTPADMADAPGASAPSRLIGPVNSDNLLSMKQQALQQLTPLVNHLNQSPEEKFRTIMMMIQASDDHTRLNEAFEAAKEITDDKARAQALLDVINEINYFTQHNGN